MPSPVDLLLLSYRVSAERIIGALTGALCIKNSRGVTPTTGSTGEVIGLCGQGGRHHYFSLPRLLLENAAAEVAGLIDLSPPNLALDRLESICLDIRRATRFRIQSGCVNDAHPALVPLFPPEEIWCDGVELPLDVWRFISYEFDVISSSLRQQSSGVTSRSGVVTVGSLLFADLMNQVQRHKVEFGVDYLSIPQMFNSAVASKCISVSASRLFIEAGLLLTSPSPNELARWYTAVRYANWLSRSSPSLRVNSQYREDYIDSRYRGLFAEEMAVGMMAIVLRDAFRVPLICNTTEVDTSVSLNGMVADFVGRVLQPKTMAPWCLIAESKGSLEREVSQERKKRAKQQVQGTQVVMPGVTSFLRLAFASTIVYDGQRRGSKCIVEDPEPNDHQERVRWDQLRAWRLTYSKALRFIGMDSAARQVLEGVPALSLPSGGDEHEASWDRGAWYLDLLGVLRSRHRLDIVTAGEGWALVMDTSVLRILRDGIDEKAASFLDQLLHSDNAIEFRRTEGSYGRYSFVNTMGFGFIDADDMDVFLAGGR